MSERAGLPQIDNLNVAGKRILVRSDLNVPLDGGRITDDLRIRAALPTLEALLGRSGRIAVCSHLGRPKGKVVEELRLAPVGERLEALLGNRVEVLDEVVGRKSHAACEGDGPVVLLENLRFEPGEESNDPGFACLRSGSPCARIDSWVAGEAALRCRPASD
jgi:phosphoglycerate kinase